MTEGVVLLLAVMALGLIAGNPLIAGAALCLLLLRAGDWEVLFPWINRYGFSLGLFIMILTVLTPLAQEHFSLSRFGSGLLSKAGLATVAVSVASALLARLGIDLLRQRPDVLVGLLVGGVVGVFLGGVPTGPLIPAGMVALAILLFR